MTFCRRAILAAVLALLCACPIVAAEYMQVRLYIDSRADYSAMRSLSLDQVFKGDGYIDIVTNSAQLEELTQLGLRTEIVHDDLVSFYQSRIAAHRDMGGYMTLSEVNAAVDAIIADHPDIVSAKQNIGTTVQGRPMWAFKISDNPNVDEDEPEVMFTAAIHAREVITPLVLLNAINILTDDYRTDPAIAELVDSREMWFVAVVNPDGYYYNESTDPGGGGMWRKNRRNNGDGTYGVDLNRNFGYQWGYDDEGSDPSSGEETYRGPSAFSEPETQNMRDFTIAHEFVSTIYFHSYSNLVLYPWGYDYLLTPDDDLLAILADSMAAYNSYAPGPAHGLYPANGVTDDWGYGEQTLKNKNLTFTLEVGSGADGFWPDPARIPTLIDENLGAILFAARSAGNPYGLMPPAAPVAAVADTSDAASYAVTWTSNDTVNPAVYFELVEMAGYQRLTDVCNGFDNWDNDGFALSSAHSHSTPNAFFSGSAANLSNHCISAAPITVGAGDTLRMWLWYDIEEDWDYAYVEGSLDGSTFTPLAGNVTTNSDPNGQNLGNGITGSSGGWVEAFFDLSAYVGDKIYIRLSYVTDGYVDDPGIWFDDIYPVDGYEFELTIASDLTGSSYTFTNKPAGEYFYKMRGQDAEGQWSRFSQIVSTTVVDGGAVCYDTDGDGYGDPDHPENTCPDDNCPDIFNDDQSDSDADDIGDVCDVCPNDADNDIDADGICGDIDNCPDVYNPGQVISGGLSVGDACCCEQRGDINHDGEINIEDLIGMVNHMFQFGIGPVCPSEGDIDGMGGFMDIADLIHLVNYMFQEGPDPAPCE